MIGCMKSGGVYSTSPVEKASSLNSMSTGSSKWCGNDAWGLVMAASKSVLKSSSGDEATLARFFWGGVSWFSRRFCVARLY